MKFMQRAKRIPLTVVAVMLLAISSAGLSGGAIALACPPSPSTPKSQVQNGLNELGSDCSGSQVTKTISAAVSILSFIAGMIAIIMIILSGFRYVTSAGDSGKVAAAKTTLIYALIGVVIAALAQFLVHFVIGQSSNAITPCPKAGHSNISISDPNCK